MGSSGVECNQLDLPHWVEPLLGWYAQSGRDLPWRQTQQPYHILVSEVMLQQTQVSRVMDYYQRFLKRFPTPQVLAQASWDEILPYWKGLGFYGRGRRLHAAAQAVIEQYQGVFPQSYEQLIALPGVGDYTASAIMSFAYNQPYPALDTNLSRVLGRLWQVDDKTVRQRALQLWQDIGGDAGHQLNQALMDLGSSSCTTTPKCEACPLRTYCPSRGVVVPPSRKRTRRTDPNVQEVVIGCIHRNGQYLVGLRPEDKGGFWEFPGGKRDAGEDRRHALQRELHEELGLEHTAVRPHFHDQQVIHNGRPLRLFFHRVQILDDSEPQCLEHQQLKWVSREELASVLFLPTNQQAIERLSRMRV